MSEDKKKKKKIFTENTDIQDLSFDFLESLKIVWIFRYIVLCCIILTTIMGSIYLFFSPTQYVANYNLLISSNELINFFDVNNFIHVKKIERIPNPTTDCNLTKSGEYLTLSCSMQNLKTVPKKKKKIERIITPEHLKKLTQANIDKIIQKLLKNMNRNFEVGYVVSGDEKIIGLTINLKSNSHNYKQFITDVINEFNTLQGINLQQTLEGEIKRVSSYLATLDKTSDPQLVEDISNYIRHLNSIKVFYSQENIEKVFIKIESFEEKIITKSFQEKVKFMAIFSTIGLITGLMCAYSLQIIKNSKFKSEL